MSKNAPQDSGGEQQREDVDRRQYPRIVIVERLWCESYGVTVLVQTTNVSRGGLFLQSPFQPERGTYLLLSLPDSPDELTNISAEVMWNRSRSIIDRPGIGIRFNHREPGYRLFDFIRNRSRKRRDSIPPGIAEWASTNIYAKRS
ncbi:MAG: PilZ domain-containing protein [Deltaproteobacteria bacterium]|nr:PilZ domain-containing protein [Deltaproteobacteria bacterium]